MICDVDRVAICQSCFHLLGKNGCRREAANELKACFGALRRTAHVGDDLRGNIAVAPSNSGATVHVERTGITQLECMLEECSKSVRKIEGRPCDEWMLGF